MRTASLDDGLYDVPTGKVADIVISLEMRDRPMPRTPVARPDLRLRHELRPTTAWYRALFGHVGTPWLWTSRLLLDETALSAILNDPRVEIFAVKQDGEDIGLLELDFRVSGQCEIAFLGVAAATTGKGLGSWLMDQALERAWSRPIERLWVHTCSFDHPAALPLYLRSGFVPFRRQVGIAADPRSIGLLPREAAPHVPQI